ncbi:MULTISPECIES: tetratricopeptide repeat protein [Ensifer]|uniref:tetratricopeptide repeat protein n=1 Tax=Ensifer TaxID=106591 RepID=UPI000AEA5997|nr:MULTISPECIES: tetratricopeptide repeat protein [Ensifer]MDP9630268.1 hypothetical protein [Ensifer adhaerens]UBI74246.1 tetratricopeptide repeat protein [Ensifer canadensis]
MSDTLDWDDWEQRLALHWADFGHMDADAFIARLDVLAAELPDGDPIGLFERASAQDSLGNEANAAPLYRQALAGGLSGIRRRRATIQLASTLRNLGQIEESIALLEAERTMPSDELDDAVLGFLALSLVDAGRAQEAAGLALGRLARHLPRYNRSLKRYADALLSDA